MYTPLDIENKKFAKQMMNGYSVDEVDEFLDELTVDYEKLYKESSENEAKIAENKSKIQELEESLEKYKRLEGTLQNTLVMAQGTADEIKRVAQQQAEELLRDAQSQAKRTATDLDGQIIMKTKELEDLKKQIDVYKAKMESLLISQLELLKEANKD